MKQDWNVSLTYEVDGAPSFAEPGWDPALNELADFAMVGNSSAEGTQRITFMSTVHALEAMSAAVIAERSVRFGLLQIVSMEAFRCVKVEVRGPDSAQEQLDGVAPELAA